MGDFRRLVAFNVCKESASWRAKEEETARRAADLAIKTFGSLDFLINDVGVGNYKNIIDTSAAEYDEWNHTVTLKQAGWENPPGPRVLTENPSPADRASFIFPGDLSTRIGIQPACAALGIPRSSQYRARRLHREPTQRKNSPRALRPAEKEIIRQELNSERFQDCAPREVYATLLDEGHYLCSWRSMYRILAEHDEVRERRNLLHHPSYGKPELLATAPNQLWSWDTPALAPQVQVLPNCSVPPSGPIITCMSFWMF